MLSVFSISHEAKTDIQFRCLVSRLSSDFAFAHEWTAHRSNKLRIFAIALLGRSRLLLLHERDWCTLPISMPMLLALLLVVVVAVGMMVVRR